MQLLALLACGGSLQNGKRFTGLKPDQEHANCQLLTVLSQAIRLLQVPAQSPLIKQVYFGRLSSHRVLQCLLPHS